MLTWGATAMTLDEAVRGIKAKAGGMHHQVACHAYVRSFCTSSDGKHLLKPVGKLTTDAVRTTAGAKPMRPDLATRQSVTTRNSPGLPGFALLARPDADYATVSCLLGRSEGV